MPRILRVGWPAIAALALLAAGLSGLVAAPALAANGGGAGTSGSSIWADTWWDGNPLGPGPYIPGASGEGAVCDWTDVGGSADDLVVALGGADLPASFWPVDDSGYSPGAYQLVRWANDVSRSGSAGDHFDVVSCPSLAMVPSSATDVYTALPAAYPPSGPVEVWILWDTVPDIGSPSQSPLVGEAVQRLGLPAPLIGISPSQVGSVADATIVNFPTWLWTSGADWRTFIASAAGGGLVATAWATPVSVTWQTGWDFTSPSADPEAGVDLEPTELDLACAGPGNPYRTAIDPASASPDCGTTFTQSTFGNWVTLRASTEWDVHWALAGSDGIVGAEGGLDPIITSATRPLRVVQIESVVSRV